MMWNDGSGWGWGSWLLMSVMMLGVLALIAWVLFLLWRGPNRPEAPEPPQREQQTPEALLAERLARGEIDVDEYRRRSEALSHHQPAAPTRTS